LAKIAITWRRSAIGYASDQRRTIEGLGLHRLNHTVVHDDNPAIRGMVNKVRHLVEVADAPEEKKQALKRTRKSAPKSE